MDLSKLRQKTTARIHGDTSSWPMHLVNNRMTDGRNQFYISAEKIAQSTSLIREMRRSDFRRYFEMIPVRITNEAEEILAFKITSKRKYGMKQVDGRLVDGYPVGISKSERALIQNGIGGIKRGLIWANGEFSLGDIYKTQDEIDAETDAEMEWQQERERQRLAAAEATEQKLLTEQFLKESQSPAALAELNAKLRAAGLDELPERKDAFVDETGFWNCGDCNVVLKRNGYGASCEQCHRHYHGLPIGRLPGAINQLAAHPDGPIARESIAEVEEEDKKIPF